MLDSPRVLYPIGYGLGSEFWLSSVIASVLVDGPSCILLRLSCVIDSVQATVHAATYCEPANSTKSYSGGL